jgi:hypothetical protein
MTKWPPDDEAAQLRSEFEAELASLRVAASRRRRLHLRWPPMAAGTPPLWKGMNTKTWRRVSTKLQLYSIVALFVPGRNRFSWSEQRMLRKPKI